MKYTRTFAITAAVLGAVLAGSLAHGQGSSDAATRNAAKVRKGFAIAPVPLNMDGKNPDLVGLGSYIVNSQGGCPDCHSSDNASTYAAGGSAYFGQPKKLNPAVYLGGGNDFGPFVTLDHLYSRNLTPDKTGLPAGGMTFATFVDVMRNGTDIDLLHPSCKPGVTAGCLPPPFKGEVLQVMPWPMFQDMDDYDLLAIYQYLSAIPCVAGPADKTNPLHNECK